MNTNPTTKAVAMGNVRSSLVDGIMRGIILLFDR
jgi:hypothetical protein